jgi:hypothetical protein
MMRNTLILFILILTNSVYSQKTKFEGGMLLSYNLVGFIGNLHEFTEMSENTFPMGTFSTGFLTKMKWDKYHALKFEIRYIKKGILFDNLSTNYLKINLNYVELPFIFEWKKLLTKKRKIYFETGLAYAWLFDNSSDFANTNNQFEIPDCENFRKQDISIIGGIKYPFFNYKEEKFLVGIRSSCSLFSINENFKLYNMVFGFEINYIL